MQHDEGYTAKATQKFLARDSITAKKNVIITASMTASHFKTGRFTG